MSPVACPALQYFFHTTAQQEDFRKKKKEVPAYKLCFDFVYNF